MQGNTGDAKEQAAATSGSELVCPVCHSTIEDERRLTHPASMHRAGRSLECKMCGTVVVPGRLPDRLSDGEHKILWNLSGFWRLVVGTADVKCPASARCALVRDVFFLEPSPEVRVKERQAGRVMVDTIFGDVYLKHRDVTLEDVTRLVVRGLIAPGEGCGGLPSYELTEAGRKALDNENERRGIITYRG